MARVTPTRAQRLQYAMGGFTCANGIARCRMMNAFRKHLDAGHNLAPRAFHGWMRDIEEHNCDPDMYDVHGERLKKRESQVPKLPTAQANQAALAGISRRANTEASETMQALGASTNRKKRRTRRAKNKLSKDTAALSRAATRTPQTAHVLTYEHAAGGNVSAITDKREVRAKSNSEDRERAAAPTRPAVKDVNMKESNDAVKADACSDNEDVEMDLEEARAEEAATQAKLRRIQLERKLAVKKKRRAEK